jgi:hypothetical protein
MPFSKCMAVEGRAAAYFFEVIPLRSSNRGIPVGRTGKIHRLGLQILLYEE